MLYIRTETREMAIHNVDGEKYFDAIMKMMLEERTVPSMGEDAPARKPDATTGMVAPARLDEPIQKEAECLHEKPVGEREEGYKGFMHITCSRCGRAKTFHAKEKMTVYRCCDCGKETELKDMRRAYTSCECGQDSYYLTNSKQDLIDIPCVNCGAPVTVAWNGFEKKYETIGAIGE